MGEPMEVDALIERLVREARVPGRAARDDLRRELATHFEDAGTSPARLQQAMTRFGDAAMVADQFQRVYRWDYAFVYAIKIAAAVLLSAIAAIGCQLLINLRLDTNALQLAPGFAKAALISIAVVLALATAWEISRRPFDRWRTATALGAYVAIAAIAQAVSATAWQAFGPATALVLVGFLCARLDRAPARLVRLFCAFVAVMYAAHLSARIDFGAIHAVLASAALLAVWTSTVTILSRCDAAFLDIFERG